MINRKRKRKNLFDEDQVIVNQKYETDKWLETLTRMWDFQRDENTKNEHLAVKHLIKKLKNKRKKNQSKPDA